MDLACNTGVPVLAVHDAKVVRAGSMGQCGIGLDIAWQEEGDQWQVRYCHLSEIAQGSGEVRAGQVLGYAGNTGWSTGPHLHLVMWKNEARIDPEQCLRTPITVAAPGDRVLRALDIVWGWANRLEDPSEISAEEQSQAAAEMKGAVVAVKEEAGLQ